MAKKRLLKKTEKSIKTKKSRKIDRINKKEIKEILYDIIDEWAEEQNLLVFLENKDIRILTNRILGFLTI